jgi:hypothetical protein
VRGGETYGGRGLVGLELLDVEVLDEVCGAGGRGRIGQYRGDGGCVGDLPRRAAALLANARVREAVRACGKFVNRGV